MQLLPLHQALKDNQDSVCVKNLLNNPNCSLKDRNRKNRIPLHVAAKMGRPDLIEILIPKTNDGNPNFSYFRDIRNFTPLGLAVMKGHIPCFDEIMRIKKLCEGMGFLNSISEGEDKETLLHLAIRYNQTKMLKHILNAYPEESKRLFRMENEEGHIPITLAAALGSKKAVSMLLNKGESIEALDRKSRTPFFHAVENEDIEMIQFLAINKCNTNPIDIDNNIPIAKGAKFKNLYDKFISEYKYKEKFYSENPHLNKPEGLIFQGGGPKGIGFYGAVLALDEEDLLSSVKRLAGTSAGAMMATFIAMGCSTNDIYELITQTPGMYFLDFNPSMGGFCDGDSFLKWIECVIEGKTGIKHCTFGELADLIEEGKKFKHLHTFAIKVGNENELIHFSSEDPQWKDVIVAGAVRCSMSIPYLFKPYTPISKKLVDGQIIYYVGQYEDRDYDQLVKRISAVKDVPSYLDGGIIYNFPKKVFDREKYIHRGVHKERGDFGVFNDRVIGFSLHPLSKLNQNPATKPSDEKIKTMFGVFQAYRSAKRDKKSHIELMESDPRSARHNIKLSTCGIRLCEFWTNAHEGKGQKAIKEAYNLIKSIFAKRRDEVKYLVPEPVPRAHHYFQLNYGSDWKETLHIYSGIRPNNLPKTILACMVLPFTLGYNSVEYDKDINSKAELGLSRINFDSLKTHNKEMMIFREIISNRIDGADQVYNSNPHFFHNKMVMAVLKYHLVYQDNTKYYEYFSNKKIKLNFKNKDGNTAIQEALSYELYNSFEALLKNALDLLDDTLLDAEGNTILHSIAMNEDWTAYNILKKFPEKLQPLFKVKNKQGKTPLDITKDRFSLIRSDLEQDQLQNRSRSDSLSSSSEEVHFRSPKKRAPAPLPQKSVPPPTMQSVGPMWDHTEYINQYKWPCSSELKRGLHLIGDEYSFRRVSGQGEICGYRAFAGALLYFHSHHPILREDIKIKGDEFVTSAVRTILTILEKAPVKLEQLLNDPKELNSMVSSLKVLVRSHSLKKASDRFEFIDLEIFRDIFSASKIGLLDAREVGKDVRMQEEKFNFCLLYVSSDDHAGHYDLAIRKKIF